MTVAKKTLKKKLMVQKPTTAVVHYDFNGQFAPCGSTKRQAITLNEVTCLKCLRHELYMRGGTIDSLKAEVADWQNKLSLANQELMRLRPFVVAKLAGAEHLPRFRELQRTTVEQAAAVETNRRLERILSDAKAECNRLRQAVGSHKREMLPLKNLVRHQASVISTLLDAKV